MLDMQTALKEDSLCYIKTIEPIRYILEDSMKMKALLVLFAVLLLATGCSGTTTSKVNIAPTKQYTATPEMQQQRLDLINKLIAQGIFSKVEKPASLPHVWITTAFKALSFDDKNTFIGVVWSYYICQDASADIVVLYDNLTGKEYGTYAEVYGGLKLK
jgi:hypothetical protein